MIILKPIGIVRHNYPDEHVKNMLSGVDGYVEVFQEYRSGLIGLEGFSHIIIIAYLHKVAPEHRKILTVKPRGLAKKLGIPLEILPEVGVFATESPHRPNPIALTIVKVLGIDIDKGIIYVQGLDLFNETPVLDIKPYTPSRIVKSIEMPKWYKELLSSAKCDPNLC